MSPRPRCSAGIVIQEQNHLTYLIFGQEVLPDRHGRNPRSGFFRQSRATGGDTPEQEGFLQLCDGTHVLEVKRRGVQARSIRSLAVQSVAMAILAILDINRSE